MSGTLDKTGWIMPASRVATKRVIILDPRFPNRDAHAIEGNKFHPERVGPRFARFRRFRNTIPLRAKADADVRDLYWFAGKTSLGKCRATGVLSWKSTPGDYELTALDDHGRAGSCKVKVR
jgi:membrane carboxypeptidase/penicillin-binding protein PbpC